MSKKHTCPSCGAPVDIPSTENSVVQCPFCGSTIELSSSQDEEIWNNLTESLKALTNAVSGTQDTAVLLPKLDDKECEKKVAEQLVITDFVPTDIFKSFAMENIHRILYPVYVYDVNWTAQWSATFRRQVSHEEQKYDYKGHPDGKKTVYETQYRDANGTSVGNTKVILPGLSKRMKEFDSVIYHFKNNTGEQIPLDKIEKDRFKEWNLISAEYTGNEVWEKNRNSAEASVKLNVGSVVSSDAKRMSSGWSVDDTHYTYDYKYSAGQCVMLPIWMAEYKHAGNKHGVTLLASDGTVFMHKPLPVNQEEVKRKEEQKTDAKAYGKKQIFGLFFVVLIAFFIVLLSSNKIMYSWIETVVVSAIMLSLISFRLGRKWQKKKLNSQSFTEQMLFSSKVKRKEAAQKKYGLEVNIGEKPEEKHPSSTFGKIVYWTLMVFFAVSVVICLKGFNQTQKEKTATENQYRLEESAKQRIVGIYRFNEAGNIHVIELKAGGEVIASEYDGISKYTGNWTLIDPNKTIDVRVKYDYTTVWHIIDGEAYKSSIQGNDYGLSYKVERIR